MDEYTREDYRIMAEEGKYVMIVATISLFLSFFNIGAIIWVWHMVNK